MLSWRRAEGEGATVFGTAPPSKLGRTAPAIGNSQAAPLRGAGLAAAALIPVVVLFVVKSANVAGRSAASAIDATIVISTMTAIFLLYRQFNESRRVRELVLLGALAAVAAVDAMFLALLAVDRSAPLGDRSGARLACEMLVAGGLAAAAFMPARQVAGSPRRLAVRVMLAAVTAVTVAQTLQMLTGASWASVSRHLGALGAIQPPLAFAVHLIAGVTLLAAAIAFAKSLPRGGGQAALLAAVSELLGVATLQFVVAPEMSGVSVTPADLLRVSAAVLILAVAIREYGSLRRDIERRAITAERARLARDLHDSLAQDLAFIASHSDRFVSELGGNHPLTVAAQRALDASRGAIIDLSASSASSTLMAVEAVCGELERRYSVEIDVRLADEDAARSSDFDAGSREHITRITREAIVNAIKHGRAQRIEVELGSPATEQLLRVSDNGCGLIERGPGSAYGLGLGLETMRTRASSLGARMVVRRRSAGGTELLVLRT